MNSTCKTDVQLNRFNKILQALHARTFTTRAVLELVETRSFTIPC